MAERRPSPLRLPRSSARTFGGLASHWPTSSSRKPWRSESAGAGTATPLHRATTPLARASPSSKSEACSPKPSSPTGGSVRRAGACLPLAQPAQSTAMPLRPSSLPDRGPCCSSCGCTAVEHALHTNHHWEVLPRECLTCDCEQFTMGNRGIQANPNFQREYICRICGIRHTQFGPGASRRVCPDVRCQRKNKQRTRMIPASL